MEVIKGTAPGIVIFPFNRPGTGAVAAAGTASGAASGTASGAAWGASAPAAAGRSVSPQRWGEPPTGQPLSTMKQLKSGSLGIPLPTAADKDAEKTPPKPAN